MKILSAWLLNYPCPVCGKDGNGRNSICPECRKLLHFFDQNNHCPGCGGPLSGILNTCMSCTAIGARPWLDAFSVMEYCSDARELLLRFKYGKELELARPLAELMDQYLPILPGDVIVPMPIHYRRRWSRGYNQAELLARELGRRRNLPVVNALQRIKGSRQQEGLTRKQRFNNLRGAFRQRKGIDLSAQRVLLLDDVFTTGSTLTRAAKALHCRELRVISLARR